MAETADIPTIEKAIVGILDTLKTAGTLGAYIVDEGKINLLATDYPGFPCAVMLPPSVRTQFDTSHENLREMTFDVLVVQKGENISKPYQTGTLMQAVLDAFDKDPTLAAASGIALGQMQPASVDQFTLSTPDKTLVVFVLSLKYEALFQYR